MLHLTLLGESSARAGNKSAARLVFRTQKAFALLAYLAIERRRVTRDELAALLWPEVPSGQGRHSLRQALFDIRQALGPGDGMALRTDRRGVSLDDRRIRVDVRTFAWLVERHTPRALRHACRVYRGDLLAGLHTREHPFDTWLEIERWRLRATSIQVHDELLASLIGSRNHAESIGVARALVRIDPFHEAAHRAIAESFVALGNPRAGWSHLYVYFQLLFDRGRTAERATLRLFEELTTHAGGGSSTMPRFSEPPAPAKKME